MLAGLQRGLSTREFTADVFGLTLALMGLATAARPSPPDTVASFFFSRTCLWYSMNTKAKQTRRKRRVNELTGLPPGCMGGDGPSRCVEYFEFFLGCGGLASCEGLRCCGPAADSNVGASTFESACFCVSSLCVYINVSLSLSVCGCVCA